MTTERRSRARILLADDDVIFRSLCIAKLKAFGWEIVEAGDGVEAWHQIKDGGFALALLDIDMPHMNGVALAQCIRSHRLTRHVPIVMITSREDLGTLRLTLQAGATSYLTKPVNWSLFNDHIAHLVTLGQGLEPAAQGAVRQSSVVGASLALNRLFALEYKKRAGDDPGLADVARSLSDLSELIAGVDGQVAEAVDVRLAFDKVAGEAVGVEVERGESEACWPVFTVTEAFDALMRELAASAGEAGAGAGRCVLSLECGGEGLSVGMRIGAPRMEDAKAFSLRLNRIAVLAQLNGGEIFLEEEVGDAQLWFGVRFEKSRCCAMAQSGPVKAVTGV